jgi:Cd2+/Zn2+-exporting ATPase
MEELKKPTMLQIQGLDCADCALNLERAVQALPGIESARVVYATSRMLVTPENGEVMLPAIQQVAHAMGYTVAEDARPGEPPQEAQESWLRRHLHDLNTILGGMLMLVAFVLRWLGVPSVVSNVLFSGAIVLGGLPVVRAGWTTLRKAHSLDMNALMGIAAVGAMAVGEFAEGAVTIFLFSVGELLEEYSADRARNAIRSLMELAPQEAIRMRGALEERVPVAELEVGDRIVVRPGDRVSMDGRIVEGRSAVDQAPVTGESVPVEKALGDDVFAGTINGSGALVVQVTRLAADNTISRIMRMVEEAQAQRAPTQRFVDRFARVYTPAVMALAAGIAFLPPLLGFGPLSVWGYRALVMLVIACPCALVISTPVTIVSALARAAKAGVLIKGGRYLEELGQLRVVAFDKTGTLTQGRPQIVGGGCAYHPDSAVACTHCDDLLAKAAAIEARSEHALARAVIRHSEELGLAGRYASGEGVTAHAGLGIEGLVEGHHVSVGSHAFCHRDENGQSPLCEEMMRAEAEGHTVLVVQDSCCGSTCFFTVADALRDEAGRAVATLRQAGIEHVVMLTGDNAYIAEQIGRQVGVDEIHAGLLPEDKVRVMEELQARYGRVAMVGDGVNDAPALAKSSVGIAMGAAGTDTALETADVALMSDDLSRLSFAMRLGRAAMNTIRINIIFALVFKATFLALAVAGISTLWMADTGASLLVSLNGMRMLRHEAEPRRGSRAGV